MRSIQLAILLGVSLGLMACGFYMLNILDQFRLAIPPLLLFLGIFIGLMISAFSIGDHRAFLRAASTFDFRGFSDTCHILNYFQTLGGIALMSGFLGFLISTVILLQNLDSMESMGISVALGIQCLAYGYVVRMIAFATVERLSFQLKAQSISVLNAGK